MSSYINLETEKIVGAEPFTKKWFHEQGHSVYNNSDKGIKNSYRMGFYFYCAVTLGIFGLPISIFSLSAAVFICIFWSYFIYEEFWAWKYAYKQLKGGKKNGLEKKER